MSEITLKYYRIILKSNKARIRHCISFLIEPECFWDYKHDIVGIKGIIILYCIVGNTIRQARQTSAAGAGYHEKKKWDRLKRKYILHKIVPSEVDVLWKF